MLMLLFLFALFTQIVINTKSTFVSDLQHWVSFAIAADRLMLNYFGLFFLKGIFQYFYFIVIYSTLFRLLIFNPLFIVRVRNLLISFLNLFNFLLFLLDLCVVYLKFFCQLRNLIFLNFFKVELDSFLFDFCQYLKVTVIDDHNLIFILIKIVKTVSLGNVLKGCRNVAFDVFQLLILMLIDMYLFVLNNFNQHGFKQQCII